MLRLLLELLLARLANVVVQSRRSHRLDIESDWPDRKVQRQGPIALFEVRQGTIDGEQRPVERCQFEPTHSQRQTSRVVEKGGGVCVPDETGRDGGRSFDSRVARARELRHRECDEKRRTDSIRPGHLRAVYQPNKLPQPAAWFRLAPAGPNLS